MRKLTPRGPLVHKITSADAAYRVDRKVTGRSGWSRCYHVQVPAVSSGVAASGSSRCRIPLLRGGVYGLPPHIVQNPRAASSRNSESDPSSKSYCTHRTLRGSVTVLPSPNESAQHRTSARYIPAAASLGLWIRQSAPMEEHGD